MKQKSLSLIILILVFNSSLFSQIFSKITSGDVVNSGGHSYGNSWVDIDLDGDLDLFVSNFNSQNNNLFENLGNGNFNQIFNHPLTTDFAQSLGNSWIDFDNDCDLDFFVVEGGQNQLQANQLYENINGDFIEIASGDIVSDLGYSQSSNWADYDNDGLIDLFVANLIDQENFLYHNEGGGTFTKINNNITSYELESNYANWIDFNNDGWMDLFVVNRFGLNNQLFKNDGTGNFIEITSGIIVNDGGNSYGSSWGDYDNDGDFDLFVANKTDEDNFLYQNNGDETFTKITSGILVNDGGKTYGSEWADVDNDGDLDIVITNQSGNNNRLYLNNGDATFTSATTEVVSTDGGSSRGCSVVDYDNDGDLDIFIANRSNENNFLYQNNGNTNNWLKIKSIGSISNRASIGTKIRLKATINGNPTWQLRHIASEYGYTSQSSLEPHFGLGDATIVDSIVIEYPSGVVCTYTNLSSNQWLVFHESDCIDVLETQVFEICEGETLLLSTGNNSSVWQTDSIGNVFFVGSEITIGPLFQDTIIYSTALNSCALDSKFKYEIKINNVDSTLTTFNICTGDTLFLNNEVITESGIYTITEQGVNGCDSIHQDNVIVESVIQLFELIELCPNDSVLVFGNYVSTSGIFTQNFPSNFSCDTILEIEVALQEDMELQINSVFCQNAGAGSAVVEIINGISPFDYDWSNSTTNAAMISVDAIGNYSLTVTDANGCSAVDFYTVEENNPIMLDLDITNVSCLGGDDGAVSISGMMGLNFEFSLDGTNFFPNSEFLNLGVGDYVLNILDEEGCVHIQEFQIQEASDFQVFLSPSINIFLGENAMINSQVNPPNPNYIYEWIPTEGLNCTDCPNPIASPTETTNYTLIVTDENGCTSVANILVEIEIRKNVYIPNAFSPNGDGDNDFLTIYSDTSVDKVLNFEIFDRWGEVVFKNENFMTNDFAAGWNGFFLNKKMNPGVFAYIARVKYVDGEVEMFKGDITLLP